MRRYNLILGILNIIVGVFTAMFIILMQNILALIMGILYIVFGIAMLNNRIYGKLLYWGILPLSILFSSSMIISSFDEHVPSYFQTPAWLSLLIIFILLLVIVWDIVKIRKNVKGTCNLIAEKGAP